MWWKLQHSWKSVQTMAKKINLLNSPNKITNVDDMMIHNLINILSKLYLICEI
jgi:hypothetical protein